MSTHVRPFTLNNVSGAYTKLARNEKSDLTLHFFFRFDRFTLDNSFCPSELSVRLAFCVAIIPVSSLSSATSFVLIISFCKELVLMLDR